MSDLVVLAESTVDTMTIFSSWPVHAIGKSARGAEDSVSNHF